MSIIPLIKDFMTTSVTTLDPEMSIIDAITIFTHKGLGGAPVVDENNHVLGILTERDTMSVAANGSFFNGNFGTVKTYMNPDVKTVHPDNDLFYLASRFRNEPFRRYPVVKNDILVGVVSRKDVLTECLRLWKMNTQKSTNFLTKYLHANA